MTSRSSRSRKSATAVVDPKPAPARTHRSLPWKPLAAGVVALAVALGGHVAWRWWRLPARVQAALPAPPDLSRHPPVLSQELAKAQGLLAARGTAREGVAQLGRLYHANNFPREAEACWRILAGEEPDVARWSYYYSHTRRTAGDYDQVARLLRRTLEHAPDYAPALLQLAEIEFKQGNMAAAGELHQRRLSLLPGDPYARLGLARVALQQGRRDDARRMLDELCRDVPNFPSSHNVYAELLAADGDQRGADRHRWLGREAGRFRDADDPWLTELDAFCYEPARLRMLATMANQTGNNERALELLQRALELAPNDRPTYESLGDLYLKLNQAEAARDTLRRGLDLQVDTKPSPRSFVNLSQAFRLLKDPNGSLAAAEEGIARAGYAFEVHDAKGIALAELGRREEAVSSFRTALSLQPNDANANYNLALTLLALERMPEAYQHLERSLTLEPTFIKSLTLLADLEMDAGRLDSAGTHIRRIYESAPGMPRAQQLMGFWHLKAGTAAQSKDDLATAERHYREGMAIDPESSELCASLGVLYLIQGRFEDALAPLETYRRRAPETPQSSLFLGQVYLALGRVPEARRVLEEGKSIAEKAGNKTTAENCRAILQEL